MQESMKMISIKIPIAVPILMMMGNASLSYAISVTLPNNVSEIKFLFDLISFSDNGFL